MKTLPTVLILAFCVLGSGKTGMAADENTESHSEGWVDLFDGESFHGWRLRGGEADIYIDDGVIVYRAIMGSPSACIATEKHYDDFILVFDVKVLGEINTGMNFRYRVREKDAEVVGLNGSLKESKKLRKAGEMWGYQCEIDPKDRAWTGGLYESGNRGWLAPLVDNEPARKAYRRGEWNTLKIKAQGNRIQTWVNGVLAVDTTDDNCTSGFIGMQLHGVKREHQPGMKSMWRNLRIKEL